MRVKENEPIDWADTSVESKIENLKKKTERYPFLKGLAQFGEDYIVGSAEDTRGAEPEFPEQWKPEKIRKENRPEAATPSLNLEETLLPGEKLKFNAGRYGPAIAGAIFTGGATLKGLAKPYTNKAIGKAIVDDVKQAKREAKHEYGEFFNGIEQQNPGQIQMSMSPQELQAVLDAVPDKKYYKGIQKAIDNPTPRNIHFAQSDLGKFQRKMADKKELGSAESAALKIAIEGQDKLKQDLYRGLLNIGGFEAPFRYANLTEKFAKNLIPYLENQYVRKASLKPGQKGYINPKRLPQKLSLQSSDPFKAHIKGDPLTGKSINPYLHGKYPELKINRALTNPYLLSSLGVTGGIAGLAKLLMGKE